MDLPDWLSLNEKGILTIDPDIAYPWIYGELEKKGLKIKAKDFDQYWIEVFYQCAKLEVMRLITGTDLDPRPAATLVIHINADGGRKQRWALANFPQGRGAEAASKGGEAKAHYRAWRGFVPN